jgi:preprotein translocase subunit SecA
MRIFGSDRISGLMQRLGMEEGVPIEHGMVTRAIERAQRQVEAQNFSVRKHLLEYDDVMNKQRESVYTLRREILEGKVHLTEDDVADTREYVMATAEEILDDKVDTFAGKDIDENDWDVAALRRDLTQTFSLNDADYDEIGLQNKSTEELRDMLWERITARYEEKEKIVPPELLRRVERDLMLQIVDQQWKDHLYSLDHLKEGIGLRGYGQRDPLVEYKKESFQLFQDMRGRIEEEIVRYLWWLKPVVEGEGGEAAPVRSPRPAARKAAPLSYNDPSASRAPAFVGAGAAATATGGRAAGGRAPQPARVGGDDAPIKTIKRDEPKIGRNDPCWCGSGKKFKKCHGA